MKLKRNYLSIKIIGISGVGKLIDQGIIHNQCLTNDPEKRIEGLRLLEENFLQLPNKQQAWNDLHILANDKDSYVRTRAISTFGSVFLYIPDKEQAWNDLHKLTNDSDDSVRSRATLAIGFAFPNLPDKEQAWEDLHKLTTDESGLSEFVFPVRSRAAFAIGFAFPNLPDKKQAWEDLHRLTTDKHILVRNGAANGIGHAFPYLPNKKQAWEDLHRLINEEDGAVKRGAAEGLYSAFSYIPDKQQAGEDLHKLTIDRDSYVRRRAARTLSLLPQIPNRQQAWEDLRRLIKDSNSHVRGLAADAISSTFSHLPDKQQAWNDLISLTADGRDHVRNQANHSLGKVSIFKASQAETEVDYKKELEAAIEFFEKTSQESNAYCPSEFCLPFYRSFHAIIFKKKEAKKEVDKYLVIAKDAAKGSKSKELLFRAVENLANALNEVQNLEYLDLEAKKGELNFYRQYCNRAAELLIDTAESAPFATIVMKKGLPILDRNLKDLLEEIQEKSTIACKKSRGTATEKIVCEIKREVQEREIIDEEELNQFLEDMAYSLKRKVSDVSDNAYLLNKIESMRNEKNPRKKLNTLGFIIENLPTIKVISKKELEQQLIPINHKLDNISDNTNLIYNEIINIKDKLSCISFDTSKMKWNLAEVISNLKTMKEELEKLNRIEGLNTLSIEKLNYSQAKILNELNNNILKSLNEIEILANKLPNKEDAKKILDSIDKLKQSKLEILFQKSVDIISLIGSAMQVFPYLVA